MSTTHFDQLQLAERWDLSAKTPVSWQVRVIAPKFIRLPGKVIYRRVPQGRTAFGPG